MRHLQIELWEARKGEFQYRGRTFDWTATMFKINLRRRRIRVRTFYDRHLRCRIAQVLVGEGYGSR